MDSITHIAIGACIGEAVLGKKIGKKAMLIGAIAQSVPDIDFISALWMSPAGNLLAHRGITHSFLFAILCALLLGFACKKLYGSYPVSIKIWLLFFGGQIFIHIFLDAFNVYGIGWFEPFSHYRVSFNTIFVADPFFSLWPGIALIVLLALKKNNNKRSWWVKFGIGLSSLYLFYCVINKSKMDNQVKNAFTYQHIIYKRYFTTPTAMNNWLWYIVVENDSGYLIGYRSLFDEREQVDFSYFPRKDILLDTISDHIDLQQLIRFSNGYYTTEQWHDTLVFNDIRFGQMNGWMNPYAHFAFHYYLQHTGDNRLIVQRGRFGQWNLETVKFLFQRIKGRKIPVKDDEFRLMLK